MSLPPLAPIPPAKVRLSLAPEEWSACLDAWISLAELTLRLPSKDPDKQASAKSSLAAFLRSFYHETSQLDPNDDTLQNSKGQQLQKTCFRLTHWVLTQGSDREALLDLGFITDFSHSHVKSPALARLMNQLWKEHRPRLESVTVPYKSKLTSRLESTANQDLTLELHRLATLLRASLDAAILFMTGSDFLDALASFYAKSNAREDRKCTVLILYLGLESLVKVEPQNLSLLSDHLYGLKSAADNAHFKDSVLADVVTNTPLVSRLRRSVTGKGSDRLHKLLNTLETYRSSSIARPRKRVRRNLEKGKGKAGPVDGELHMHRMSLVTQVQDLFPDLESGFIMKLLDEYHDDVEQVIAHLLDDSLPPHLQSLDRTQQVPDLDGPQSAEIDALTPRSTPPPPDSYIPERRNVFDDDELDRLQFDTSRLHIGKKKEAPLNSSSNNKAAILSALAAFDSDDDERDDTYDVDDVGGTIDTRNPDGEPATAGPSRSVSDETDATLFHLYKSSPNLFGRTFDIRRGQPRQALKAETGMTDEAIEGWAIMLQRDPKRLRGLEERFSGAGAWDGRQTELGRSAYRESPGGTETEDSDAANAPRGGFRGRGRGRGRGGGGRGGRGGSVAGPSDDAGTATAQRRKEESKGSRANHNRRDQRARKMARGGFAG